MDVVDIEELAIIYAKEDGIYYEWASGYVTDVAYEEFIEKYEEFIRAKLSEKE